MEKNIDIMEILNIIPHRYPFLLIDRVIDIEPDKSITAIKNVTFNEPFFQGHFPGQPIMPGVLILEALAQTGAAIVLSKEENKGKIALFVGANNVKFRRMVIPGDVLMLKCEVMKYRARFGVAKCVATVENEIACEAEISFAIQ